jgi:hypothetical protein
MGITVRLSQTPIVAAESRHPPGHGRTTPLARGAAILYQVKERHVLENRIRAWVNVVAINPCQWIEGLYSPEGGTRKVHGILVWQEGTLHCIVLLDYIVLRDRTVAASSRLKSVITHTMNSSLHRQIF